MLLALRRKPLSVLHVYHHAVVIPETWLMTRTNLPWSLGLVAMNAGVHIIMCVASIKGFTATMRKGPRGAGVRGGGWHTHVVT